MKIIVTVSICHKIIWIINSFKTDIFARQSAQGFPFGFNAALDKHRVMNNNE